MQSSRDAYCGMCAWKLVASSYDIEKPLWVRNVTRRPSLSSKLSGDIVLHHSGRLRTQSFLHHQPSVDYNHYGLDAWLLHELFRTHTVYIVAVCRDLRVDARQWRIQGVGSTNRCKQQHKRECSSERKSFFVYDVGYENSYRHLFVPCIQFLPWLSAGVYSVRDEVSVHLT